MFRGSLVAIVTPMTADGGLDWPAWDRLLDFHVREGTDGIVVAGTTGESPALTLDEIEELSRRAVARCSGKLKVDRRCRNSFDIEHSGADARFSRGSASMPSCWSRPTTISRLRRVCTGTSWRRPMRREVPVILYNVPSRTAVDLLPGTIARLARHPQIVAVKDASASLIRARELLAACPREFAVLSGDDATAIEWMGIGARGVISVTANVAPRRMHEACEAALGGDLAAARVLDADLQLLHRDLFVEANPIPVKWAVARMGLIGNAIRLPLVDLSPAHHDTVVRAMRAAGITLEERAA